MNAKEIIKELLARTEEPSCAEQREAVEKAKAFLEILEQPGFPRTEAAVRDCFQTGLHQKVKADAMKELELELNNKNNKK